jgi:hypothetical protein
MQKEKNFPHNAWSWVKPMLIGLGILILLFTAEIEREMLWLVPLMLAFGFFFGKLTCDINLKNAGFFITIGFFALLNFIHSMIDGVALLELSTLQRFLGIAGHEIIRQPALYLLVFGILEPFRISWKKKFGLAALAVTGVWALGFFVGQYGGGLVEQSELFHKIIGYSIFLFIGDILHHLYDHFEHHGHTHSH